MATTGQLALLIVAIAAFVAGGAVSLARVWYNPSWGRLTAKVLLYFGIAFSLIVLVWHSVSRRSWLPLEDNFDTLLWLALVLAVFVMYVQRRRPLGGLDWFVMPIVILLLIGAAVSGVTNPHVYDVSSLWSWVHRAGAYGGAAAFAVAGAAGAMYLLANRRLRQKIALAGPYFGSLERLEHLTLSAVTLGFALLTVGAITGFVQMSVAHRSAPLAKIILSAAVWLIYAIVLHSPINPSFRGRRAAVLSIVGFVLMVGTVVAVLFLPRGHLMQRLMMLGLNHITAPLEVRERVAFNPDQQRRAVQLLREGYRECEAVILSTCNRMEVYVAREVHAQPRGDAVARFISEFHNVPVEQFKSHLYERAERDVVEHLFSVASSLESMVLGETQVLGQVRQAYDISLALKATGPALNPLFQRAIAAGREVLGSTPLAEGRVSVSGVAVDYARKIFDHFDDKTVLCVGAGKMALLALHGFAELGPGKLIVCNRDAQKASSIAARFNGVGASLNALMQHLIEADIVITSTGSTEPIITRSQMESLLKQRRYRPIFMIDIAVPRDVEPTVAALDHVFLYNLDDLQKAVALTHDTRSEAVESARLIVARHVEEFLAARRQRELGPLIDQLYKRMHELAADEVVRTINRIPDVTDQQRAHLEDLARRIVNKLLHDPVTSLRDSDELHGPAAQYVHAIQQMFKLNEGSDNGAGE